jgi:hypothetical protein
MQTFLWLATALAGFSTRSDLLGATSFIRALGLAQRCYDRLLDFFHSKSLDVDKLARLWAQSLLARLPGVYRYQGKPVLVGDGIKIPKRGRKMPAVKRLHQVSESNTKPEYIMGHSIQVLSLLVQASDGYFALPLIGRIHEGVVFSNRDKRTLPGKFLSLHEQLELAESVYVVADAYYACRTVARGLVASKSHLISRVRKNSVAFEVVPAPEGQRPRGRPKRYGKKIRLRDVFDQKDTVWTEAPSPVYGDSAITLRYCCLDRLWKSTGTVVRFVLVDHPTRGRCILLCTDLALDPIEIIRLYGLRYKIELSFKQALHLLGAYGYHFWMQSMDKLSMRSGNQYLHRKTEKYRNAVQRKIAAYHRYIQIGLIAQGLLQCLAATEPKLVWAHFGSWLCTIRPGLPPSERVVMNALRNTLPDFLARSAKNVILQKFIRDRVDVERAEGFRLAG